MAKQITGMEAIVKAASIFAGIIGFNAALQAWRSQQGLLPPDEKTILLRSINRKLGPDPSIEDINYNEIL